MICAFALHGGRYCTRLHGHSGEHACDLETWELVVCRFCEQHHAPGTECPRVLPIGTETWL